MPSTHSRGKPIHPFDPELNPTLHRMNETHNPDNIGDGINRQLPPPVDANNQLIVENPDEGALSRETPTPCPQEYNRVNINISKSDGPLVLPPLPQGHSFVVTSSFMQMLTARGLFSGLPFEDPHAHIAKLRSVCKICVGRPDLDMDIIGFRVFPLSLM